MRELNFVFFLFFFLPFIVGWYFFLLRFGLLCVQAWSFSFVVGVGCGIFDSDPEAPATGEPRPLVGEPPLAGCARNIRVGWRVPSPNELRCALYAVDAHKVPILVRATVVSSPVSIEYPNPYIKELGPSPGDP